MTRALNCVLVDDEELDLLTISLFLEEYPFIKTMGKFESSVLALDFIKQNHPDVLFLDIDMPELSGLELRNKLREVPVCVFITSYPEYALESFDYDVFDFLLKPFNRTRFKRTINRLVEYFEIRDKAKLLNHTLGGETIFIKDGISEIKIQLHEIIYLEALNNYTSIITSKKRYSVLATLGSLLKEKAFNNFIRIHRSFAVQKHFINILKSTEVILGEISLPIGRAYKANIQELKHSFK